MKFIITRTSCWDENESPAEEAIEVEVHWYDRRTEIITRSDKAGIWKWFNKRNRDIVHLPEGIWQGVNKEPSKAWLIETDDICSLVDKYGEIIVKKPSCEEGYYELEIYDGYRE